MKKNILIIAAAAIALCMASCQKEETTITPANGVNTEASPRVKSTSDLNNTDWSYTVTYSELLTNLLGSDLSCVENFEDDTMTFGLNFDGTYAHFSFPSNVEAWGGDATNFQQINGVSYTYTYDGTTHTGYLDGVAEDVNGNDVPAHLQFTYDDATDAIIFVIPMEFVENSTPVNLTLTFLRNE